MFLRSRSGPAAGQLEWRVRLFGVGAILAILGMYFDARWMIWIAIAVLVTGFLLRFAGRNADEHEGNGEEPPEQD